MSVLIWAGVTNTQPPAHKPAERGAHHLAEPSAPSVTVGMFFLTWSRKPTTSSSGLAWVGGTLNMSIHTILGCLTKLDLEEPHTLNVPFPISLCSCRSLLLGKAYSLFRNNPRAALSRKSCLIAPRQGKPLPLSTGLSHFVQFLSTSRWSSLSSTWHGPEPA